MTVPFVLSLFTLTLVGDDCMYDSDIVSASLQLIDLFYRSTLLLLNSRRVCLPFAVVSLTLSHS